MGHFSSLLCETIVGLFEQHRTHEGANEWLNALHNRSDLFARFHTFEMSRTMVQCALHIDDHLDWMGSILSYVREDWTKEEAAQVERDLARLRRAIQREDTHARCYAKSRNEYSRTGQVVR